MVKRKPGSRTRARPKRAAQLTLGAPTALVFEPLSSAKRSARFALTGADDKAQTVIYIHGIGNHAEESMLVERWDRALFQQAMGDRTRMAYWVNRNRYPNPELCECADPHRCDCKSPRRARALDTPLDGSVDPEAEIEETVRASSRDPTQQAFLRELAHEMLAQQERATAPALGAAAIGAKGLGDDLLAGLTGLVSFIALPDVNDFFFRDERRERMLSIFKSRLETGGGPFVVVAHSQGSMIAYEVLRRLPADAVKIDRFITIGSPLGFAAVRSVFRRWTGTDKLPFPACVSQWLNVAAKGDPVAFDDDLGGDIGGAAGRFHNVLLSREERKSNPLFDGNPHAALGYLSCKPVRETVHTAVGPEFLTSLGNRVITNDLHAGLERHDDAHRHPVLIQIAEEDAGKRLSLAEGHALIANRLGALTTRSGADADTVRLTHHARFISARLTRPELEVLRSEFKDLRINRLWRNSTKRALIHRSAETIKARPAHRAYGALGRKIEWAVLDTGINHLHPHFATHRSIASLWDCTRPKTRGGGGAGVAEPDGGFVEWQGDVPRWPANADTMIDKDGHGTHVAGIVAGELAGTLEHEGDTSQFAGMAPEAKLHVFKVLDDDGAGEDAWIITALDCIARINETAGELRIHGVNLSLGGPFDPSVHGCGHTPLCNELRRLWRQGVLVVIAAGNEGFAVLRSAGAGLVDANMDLSIGDPANLEEAIAVGSVHRSNPHTYGISYFSSRGPTADGRRKPDLVAPGEKIWSARADFGQTGRSTARGAKRRAASASETASAKQLYVAASGTSMAAPHVSGALAAFLSQRREFIGYPDRVKQILLRECTDLGRDPYAQGAGMIDLAAMLATT
jgi:subtilisin family serine protease